MENIYFKKVAAVREMMLRKGWDAVIVTGSDPHSSEYSSPRWKQVEWLSGFTGEAGDMVITADHAGLWTDSRYFIQAEKQLAGTGIVLHKTGVPEQVSIPQWLREHFHGGDDTVVAVDGLCQQVREVEEINNASDVTVVDIPDMLSALWAERPPIPQTPVCTCENCGESRSEKLAWLRETVSRKACDGILLTALDDIAWILNVRGSDIEYNPMVISYLMVTSDSAQWFVLKDEFSAVDPQSADTFSAMEAEGIEVLPYSEAQISVCNALGDGSVTKLWVDPSSLNYSFFNLLSYAGELHSEKSPVQLRKAVKNGSEISGMRLAHILDGVAMEKFFYWLEAEVSSGRRVSEWDAALKLGEYRSEIDGYTGDSFETISAYGAGAALPHYATPHAGSPLLDPHGLYLCDSGGQYTFGTTDITRTVPLGPCTQLEKEDYTLVLQGHINLAMAVFPEGTPGCRLDALARIPLWSHCRNFGHGTGHGVGFWLGVHEGPQDIRQNLNSQPLLSGMITSDEPGIYREGMHGVRHENLILCREKEVNEFGRWMCFEPLTMCHFDTSAVLTGMLTAEQRTWLNDYNALVYETLSAHLPSEVAVWLKEKTAAI